MLNLKSLALLFILGLFIIGCKKNNETPPENLAEHVVNGQTCTLEFQEKSGRKIFSIRPHVLND